MTYFESLIKDARLLRDLAVALEVQVAENESLIRAHQKERDALRAENADLREDEQEALEERNVALKQRDALRAQLDGMTTEWALLYGPGKVVIGPYAERPWHGPEYVLAERLVGSWVEVE